MKKDLSFLLSALLTILGINSAQAYKNHYELRIGEFNELQVLDNINVVWTSTKDSIGYVQFYGDDRFADAFILTNNHKGTLKIQVAPEDVNNPDLPTLYVYSSFLTEVKSASSQTVTINPIAASARLKFNLVGNGTLNVIGIDCIRCDAKLTTGKGIINLAGTCQTANLNLTGTGEIRADQLQAENVNCTFMGTGAIYSWPISTLKAKGLGSTTIYYRGKPAELTKHGGGKFEQLRYAPAVVTPSSQIQTRVENQPEVQSTEMTVYEEEETIIEEAIPYEEEEEPIIIPERRN